MNRLLALSGFGAKGPACFLLEIEGRRLLLDLGEGPDSAMRPGLAGIGKVDAVLISHLHHDHTGALDLVSKLGRPPVFATGLTRSLMEGSHAAFSCTLPLSGGTEVAGIAIETGPAGHAPGAVWMRIGGPEGLLYTGDYSDEGRLFPATAPLPARALVFDASYGVADVSLAEQMAGLDAAIGDGPCLLPAPPAGRGLEMALHFMDAGRRVMLCPAHRRVAETLIAWESSPDKDVAAALTRLLRCSLPLDPGIASQDRLPDAVIIAGTADAAGGFAAGLATRIAADGVGRIVFTGHLAAETPARILTDEGLAGFARWNVHPRLACVRALLAALRPEIVMAAFLEADAVGRLARTLSGENFVFQPSFEW
ncbi:MBL fold metallo-hydrolase [Pleomorphomonas sp. NRK KF1]|uniref:MBL fold metallo-hydrolase n=1 Tax=Pleomorphomonas sp. NRK KF1 TaxID=2943000 RepID=UPI0020436F70|nr:MBL fold metallo-hydrolase [Pleomorphomonas sp. NRK KF1]MCM5551579.1 MBL fold metallo-hydrolase [Pleomorphomonas sp. NRK KF1]